MTKRSRNKSAAAALIGLLLSGVLVQQAFKPGAPLAPRDRLMVQVNEQRTARGLREVRVNADVRRTATRHAQQMAERLELYHSQLKTPAGASWAGEIIGVGGSLHSVVIAWLHSPEHRKIMLNSRARYGGAGAVLGSDGRWWLVVQFTY